MGGDHDACVVRDPTGHSAMRGGLPKSAKETHLGSLTTACKNAVLRCALTDAASLRHDFISRRRSSTAASCRTCQCCDAVRISVRMARIACLAKYAVKRSVACVRTSRAGDPAAAVS